MSDISPTDRELELLKVLWRRGAASVKEVLGELAPNGELAFNTIQTQLRIMEEKGLVTHRAQGRTFVYSAIYTRRQASSRFLSKVFDGAANDLVMSLLASKNFKESELEAMEDLIRRSRENVRNSGEDSSE